MSDDKSLRGPQDRNRINMSEDYEVRYWTKELGCSEAELASAVRAVGDRVDAVRGQLSGDARSQARR